MKWVRKVKDKNVPKHLYFHELFGLFFYVFNFYLSWPLKWVWEISEKQQIN